MALKLREAPDLGAVDPNIGFDVGGRLADGGEVDAEQLGAALQRSRDRPGESGIVGFPGLHAQQIRRTDVRRKVENNPSIFARSYYIPALS